LGQLGPEERRLKKNETQVALDHQQFLQSDQSLINDGALNPLIKNAQSQERLHGVKNMQDRNQLASMVLGSANASPEQLKYLRLQG